VTPVELLYHKYLTLCAEVSHKPVPFAGWVLLLDEVPLTYPMGFPLSKRPLDVGMAARKKPRQPGKDEQLADVHKLRLFIGELQPDGSVAPVRRQTESIAKETSLLARTCRGACQQFLPIDRFTKQGRGHRSVCRKCDNHRRRHKGIQ
jgi:hypothetical protein